MSDRMRRVNEAIREVVSEGVRTLKDPRIGFLTVTGVQASPGPAAGDRLRERPRLRAQAEATLEGLGSPAASSRRRSTESFT